MRLLPIYDLLREHARQQSDAAAILAFDSRPLTYAALFEVVTTAVADLRRFGVHREDRVAVVLPTGSELCVAIITVAAGAVCVPLDPKLADADWRTRFVDMRVRALLTTPGTNSAAERTAHDLGLQVIETSPSPAVGAGAFSLDGSPQGAGADDRPSALEDDAFVLPTSGTTSRPKVVPLTHSNILHSAIDTARILRLTPRDRLLGVLPLHHAHGLISGLMSSLVAGSSVVWMRGFRVDGFFEHLSAFRPSWYTAVPAIHQAIIHEALRWPQASEDHTLRLIRSASASLSTRHFAELERLFGVPVIETYGMTEAASQIASNPLPPGQRKPGSVGLATGPDITIRDGQHGELPAGRMGEIALRGPNLTRGYENPGSPETQRPRDGWFLTGDLGRLDADGYLFIIGRKTDLINRGGEKIVPQKIEEVMLQNPNVAEVVAFSVPSARLGEDVAAVVVLHPDTCETEQDLRRFALRSGSLAENEIPRHIVFVDEIPKSATGKIQRNRLAGALGLTDEAAYEAGRRAGYVAPTSEAERRLAAIWADVFDVAQVGTQDDFFALGGDSLLAVQVTIRVSEIFDVMLSLRTLFESPNISELSKMIAKAQAVDDDPFKLQKPSASVSIQKPVSIAQEQILNVEARLKGYPTYIVPFAYRLDGDFDPKAFERSVKRLISRHEILRSIYRRVGERWTAIPSGAINIRVPVEDWKVVPDSYRLVFIDSLLDDEIWNVFDLTRSPAFRMRLLRFSERRHALILIVHHIIMDAWTMRNLLEDLFGHYANVVCGNALSLTIPEFQFSDYARWQRKWCGSDQAAKQLEYSRRKLAGARPLLQAEGARSRNMPSFSTARVSMNIPKRVVEGLAALARRDNSTLLIALLTGLKAFLALQFGQSDLCVAIPMANRSRPNTRGMLGLIENTVVLRTKIDLDLSFRANAARVRESMLDAHAHQELPFEVIVRELARSEGDDAATFSDVYFSFLDQFEPRIDLQELLVSRIEVSQEKSSILPLNNAKLMFLLKMRQGDILGDCVFKESHFAVGEVQEIISGYVKTLASALANPDQKLGHLVAQSEGRLA